jgi:hypothetical protein
MAPPPGKPKTVTMKSMAEKDAFYTWLWLTDRKMVGAARRPMTVDAALHAKFKVAANDAKRRNGFEGGQF